MFTLPLILVAIVLPVAHGGPYISEFSGDGDASEGWPSLSDWFPDLQTMFDNNTAIMQIACTQFGSINNSEEEISNIYTSIETVANATSVDPRFIFAIIMQESNGCVRAPTSNGGVVNPGLMQSHGGTGTCNPAPDVYTNPCPYVEIEEMVLDGTNGTQSGDGLKQCLGHMNVTDVSIYYKAARLYNSGSIAYSGNLGSGGSTHCYASDVANRLIGWSTGDSTCNDATIGNLNGTLRQLLTMTPEAQVPSPMGIQTVTSSGPVYQTTATLIDIGPGSYIPSQTPCNTEGTWNCINSTSFQRCASGVWSAVILVPAGMHCIIGQATVMNLEVNS